MAITASRTTTPATAPPPPGGPKRRTRQMLQFSSMWPGLLMLGVFALYPAIYSLVISLFKWNLQSPEARAFVGLGNYQNLLSDGAFWHSVQVTVVFVAFSVALEFLFAFGLALVFFRGLPGERVMRALILMPMLVAPVVVGLLARFTLEPTFGIVNQVLRGLGLGTYDFFGSTSLALPTLIAIDVWQWSPFLFLIFLAAMQGIPEEVIEAAKIDGASWPRIIWHMFLPLLQYPLLVGLALRVIDAFRVYDLVFMTTRGGPIDVTSTMSWQIYDVGFRSFNLSYAAAFSWLLLILVMATVSTMMRRIVANQVGV